MMVYDDEGRSVVCESWNVPADYVCLLAGGRGWKCGEFAIFQVPNCYVSNVGTCTRYFAYSEMDDYYSANEFSYIPPDVQASTFGECLRQLFAGIGDYDRLYFCEPFSDDEIRQVLFDLGGDGYVAAYERGIDLVDIVGW